MNVRFGMLIFPSGWIFGTGLLKGAVIEGSAEVEISPRKTAIMIYI